MIEFHKFFNCWLGELSTTLEQLISAANHQHDHIEDDSDLNSVIDKAVGHYEEYYKAKSNGAKKDVLSMFKPTWLTKLEDSLLWIGGWRPTTAVHLLYSKSGVQLEARLADLVDPELNFKDLSDLTSSQLKQINELQTKTIRQERVITEKMATLQESAADTPIVNLSNMESEMIRNNEYDGRKSDERVESVLNGKNDELVEVLRMADNLRMETLKLLVEILTPLQAVYFLIAAAELHLRMHDWGHKKEMT